MGYYDELTSKIRGLIKSENFKEASLLIDEEFKMPYIPSDFLKTLESLRNSIPKEHIDKVLSIDKIQEYLKGSNDFQLIGVEALDSKNLREYIDICNEYLSSDGYKNAKVLLIDSLIRQEISDEIKYIDNGVEYNFIPKYQLSANNALGFKSAIKDLEELFLKEPSMLEIAKPLVYKESIMSLPINLDEDEGHELATRIYKYILDSFNNN